MKRTTLRVERTRRPSPIDALMGAFASVCAPATWSMGILELSPSIESTQLFEKESNSDSVRRPDVGTSLDTSVARERREPRKTSRKSSLASTVTRVTSSCETCPNVVPERSLTY